jgi:hypothetical protein
VGGRCKPLGDEIPLLSWSLHLLGEAEWAVVRAGSLTVFVRGVSLDSCVEARAVLVGRLRDGASVFCLWVGVSASVCRYGAGAESSPSPPGAYSVARSGLRTLPDGEFDWGGTSVKR